MPVLSVRGATDQQTKSPVTAQDDASTKPNIVVLMLDDYAAVDHRILERLPNFKALYLDHGLEGLNYWGNDPLCCPGRANFLTAQQAHHNGVTHNDARLLDPRETIATELHDVGYYTNICGKYLNRTELLADKRPPGWDNAAIMSGGYYRYNAFINGVQEYHAAADSDYSTDVFANYCSGFIESAPRDKPLFAFMTPFSPHAGADQDGTVDGFEGAPAPRFRNDSRCDGVVPWKPANYNSADLSDKPVYMQSRPLLPEAIWGGLPLDKKCRTLLATDEWLGRVVAELKVEGRYDNTIFILTADNGMGWGAFRWQPKIAPHTAQMPLFIDWPAKMTGSPLTHVSGLLTNVDLAPTLCEFAGCTMGPYPNGRPSDGQSFAGLIAPSRSSSLPTRTSIILEARGNSSIPIWSAVMTDPNGDSLGKQWFYIKYKTGETELYDLSNGPCYAWQAGMSGDPCMLTNLTTQNRYRALKKQLAGELASTW